MSLINEVLKTAEKTVAGNAQSLLQQGLKKFVDDAGIDVGSMSKEDILTAYEDFKSKHLDELINGEYLGEQAQQLSELLTYDVEKIKEQISSVSINGMKMDPQEILNSPNAVLHNAAEVMVNQQIDKIVEDKALALFQQYGIDLGSKPKEEVVGIIRDTIRGTRNSIFRNPEIKANMISKAEEAINNYYKSALEMLENPEWQEKQLKPLNDIVDKGLGQVGEFQKKLEGELGNLSKEVDKITSKIDEISKMDIAKEINDQILGKFDANGQLKDFNEMLGLFGLEKNGLDGIGGCLNTDITGIMGGGLDKTIHDNVIKMNEITQRVTEVKQYVQKYEDFVKNEIKAFEDKAKEFIKQIETELINTVLSAVHLKLGDSIKLGF